MPISQSRGNRKLKQAAASRIQAGAERSLGRAGIHRRVSLARYQDGDPHLRGCKAVMGYRIQAADGELGHAQGTLVDEETWAIHHLIVGTGNGWFGHPVLIAPQWIQNLNWSEAVVSVNLTRQAVKDAPPYDAAAPLGGSSNGMGRL